MNWKEEKMELGYILGEGFHKTLYKIMTREEEILNAAREYNNGITFSNPSNVLHFEAGAKWADEHPKNIWHKPSEEPKPHVPIIYELGDDLKMYECTAMPAWGQWSEFSSPLGVVRWAYINDLLPKTK